MSHVFDRTWWISIPLAIFWSLLVTNLYLLLLYTITPALLPVAQKKKSAIGSKVAKVVVRKDQEPKGLPLQSSLLIRIGLIIFLAGIIAQSFNVWWFIPGYEQADKFAAAIQKTWHSKPFSHVVTVLFCMLMLLPVYLKYNVRRISKKNFAREFGSDQNSVHYLRQQLGNPSDHTLVSEQILSADINAIRTSDFYFQKMLIEYKIILEEYKRFKELYSGMLTGIGNKCKQTCMQTLMPYLYQLERVNPERYDLLYPPMKKYLQAKQLEKYEYWADPPFRTACKSAEAKSATQAELLGSFYSDK